MEYNEQKTDSNPSGQPFIIELTPHGEMINSTRPEPIIQEIETQFPHILQFPSNILQKGSNWKIPFQKNGKYNSQDGSVAYTINGESMYTENGFVTITTPVGTFDCLEIVDNTTYSRNVSFTRSNITTVTETKGTITGKIWIEKHEGFLVKSEKKISLLVQSDLTDLFNQRYQKYDAVYRESPMEQEIVSELVP